MQVITHQTRSINQTWQNPLKPRTLQSPKAAETEAKINKRDLIKCISFGTTQETMNETETQPNHGRETLTNDATDEGLVSKINKQLIRLNIKKITQSRNGQRVYTEISAKKTRAVCCAQSLSCVQLFSTPWTIGHQVALSLGFSRQEHWSGLPFPSPMHESET